MHKALISLGANKDAEVTLSRMTTLFRVWIKDIKESPTLTNPAIGMKPDTPDFTNQLLELNTSLDAKDLNALCKTAEDLCGNTSEKRRNGIIVADADLLLCDDKKFHKHDWEHPYIKTLLKYLMVFSLMYSLPGYSTSLWPSPKALPSVTQSEAFQANSHKDDMGKAIEYFSGRKYHEALLYFDKIEKTHILTPRFRAYKGVCQFKEDKFEDAINTLVPIIDEMDKYPPHERALYSYAIGESYFQLGRYSEAVPHFSRALDVSLDYDKADICYRLGFCEMKCENEGMAIIWFQEADSLYNKSVLDDLTKAHREQCRRMLKALLVTHTSSGMDSADEITRKDEDKNADNQSADIDQSPERK